MSIDLYMGYPSDSLLPKDAILQATQSLLTREHIVNDVDECHPLAYGPLAGNLWVRAEIAKWAPKAFKEAEFGNACINNRRINNQSVGKEGGNESGKEGGSENGKKDAKESGSDYAQFFQNISPEILSKPVDPDCINMTNGASFGALAVLTQLTNPYPRTGHSRPWSSSSSLPPSPPSQQSSQQSPPRTRRAFIVSPTYFMINSIFMDAGFAGKVDAIQQDVKTGHIDFATLEEKLEYYSKQETDPVDARQIREYRAAAAAGHEHSNSSSSSGGGGSGNGGSSASATISHPQSCFFHDPNRPEPRKTFSFVIYVIPTFSNPSGSIMSLADRLRLLQLARKYDMLVLSDDVYDLVDYRDQNVFGQDGQGGHGGRADEARYPTELERLPDGSVDLDKMLPPRLVTLDRWSLSSSPAAPSDTPLFIGNTISNQSFSKLLSPGLRVGWQETASPYLAQKQLALSGVVRSAGTPSHYTTNLVGELLALGLVDPIIKSLTTAYAKRVSKIVRAVRRYLPRETKIYGGQGGYFLWLELPVTPQYQDKRLSAPLIAEKAKQMYDIVYASGDAFQIDGDERDLGKNCFRISVSRLSGTVIVDCIKKLGIVLDGLLDGSIGVN